MKNTLLMLASFAMAAGLASASITYTSPCSVLMSPGDTNDSGSTCTVTPDSGFFIDSLTITITDDYTGYLSGNPTVNYSGTLTQSAAVFGAPVFCAVTTAGSPSSSVPCTAGITPANTVSGLNLSFYSIQLTGTGNVVTGGAVTGASEVLTISATESPIITSGTPEPATFGLMGAALVGLGFFARKRKA
jgi:hypothetical protein